MSNLNIQKKLHQNKKSIICYSFHKCSSFSMLQRNLRGCRKFRRCTNRRSRQTNEFRGSNCSTTKSNGNSGRFSKRKMARTAQPLRSAGFRIPFRTATSRTSFILRLYLNCAAVGTVRKFCRPSAKNILTRASSSISKSKKIPRTPRNLSAGTAAANFTPTTALTPHPSNTTGRVNTIAYSAQAVPSPTKNSAISGKKFSRTFPERSIRNLLSYRCSL